MERNNERAVTMAAYISIFIKDYSEKYLRSLGLSNNKANQILKPINVGEFTKVLAGKLAEKYDDQTSWSKGEFEVPFLGNGSQHYNKSLSLIEGALRECGINPTEIGLDALHGCILSISANKDEDKIGIKLVTTDYNAWKEGNKYIREHCLIKVEEESDPFFAAKADATLYVTWCDAELTGTLGCLTHLTVDSLMNLSKNYVGHVLEDVDDLKKELAEVQEGIESCSEEVYNNYLKNGITAPQKDSDALKQLVEARAKIKNQLEYAKSLQSSTETKATELGDED